MEKIKIEVEKIKELLAQLTEFNQIPLREIDFYENGEKIKVTPKALNDFLYTGLGNADFIKHEFYKTNGFEEELP